jgi:single-stranded-DNA-specific exonuclease
LFKQRIEEICSTISIEEKALWADARVSFDMLTYSVVESIEALAPFGEGDPRPVFVARGVSLRGEIREMARNSIRFMASDGTSAINVVGFGKADFKDVVENARKFDMLFSVSINEYRGLSSVQAELLDIKSGDR